MAVSPYHLTSNGPRANTLVIDLAAIPARKVNMDLIVNFINQNLKIQFGNVVSLQHNTGKSLVFLECQTEDQALNAVDSNNGRHDIMVENVKYTVTVYMEDGATTVRVHDISPQTENSIIEQALRKYGDVIWLKEEKYVEPSALKGIKSGVRAVRIKMHTAIPSYINICGEVTLVTYKNQQQTCRHCNKPVHWGRKCMEVSYMEMQLQSGITGNISDRLKVSRMDYAGVLATGNRSKQHTNTSVESGKASRSQAANFTNLTQLFRSNHTVEDSPVPIKQSKSNPQSNITNITSEHVPLTSTQSLKDVSANQKANKQGIKNTANNETKAIVDETDFSVPTILLTNTFSALISDDDVNDKDSSRSISSSPLKGKRTRVRSRKSSK